MTWMKISLPRTGSEHIEWKRVQDSFEEIFMVRGAPTDAALFTDRSSTQPNVNLYFSPGSVSFCTVLLDLYRAEPCDRPAADSLSLLVGHHGTDSLSVDS